MILGLVEAVRNSYCDQVERVNGRRCAVEVTDTLASKILLATLGCVPAYDAYVVRGLRAEGIPYSALDGRNLGLLFEWYKDHQAAFESVQKDIDEGGLRYPPMKLVDMYLWERGQATRRVK